MDKDKSEDEFELVRITSSEEEIRVAEMRLHSLRTRVCCLCSCTGDDARHIIAPCGCLDEAGDFHDVCLERLIANTGSLTCAVCGVPYVLEPRPGCGRWSSAKVQRRARLWAITEAAALLLCLHAAVVPLAILLWYVVSLSIAAGIAYAGVLSAAGGACYVYYGVQMLRHRPACACEACVYGDTPLLCWPGRRWTYTLLLLGTPPVLWLLGVAVALALLRRRAQRYVVRSCLRAHTVRPLVK